MSKIYLPTEYLNKPCYVINNDYIRVYNTINARDNVVYDIYINQDYMVKQSTASYYDTTVCDSINTFTDDVYYRADLDKILIIYLILSIFMFYIPLKLCASFYKRRRL